MLKEPKLEAFYQPPKHDLRLNYDEEMKEEEEEFVPPWPNTESLFGEDPKYQRLITELMNHITEVVDMVLDYSEVRGPLLNPSCDTPWHLMHCHLVLLWRDVCQEFDKFCTMVDGARQVDVEGSMAKKMWSTEEFQHILSIHTDQVHTYTPQGTAAP